MLAVLGIFSSCSGYRLRAEKNEYLEERGIHRIYLAPVKNLSFKPGAENGLYNALIKKISAYNIVQLVNDPQVADAILEGMVTDARYISDGSQFVMAKDLEPKNIFTPEIKVTLQYTASLSTSFSLTQTKIKKLGDTPAVIWSTTISRSRPFSANNQGGVYGTTSAHINDSEFDRMLTELTDQIADDAHEGMVSMF